MQGNRRVDTRPELALRSALHRRGVRFRLHVTPEPHLRCRADIVIRRARLVIFVDGCFWHGCAEHGTTPSTNRSYWHAKIERNILRDRRNNQELEAQGWTVVRVWEHEDADVAAARIVEALASWRDAAKGPPNTAARPG